ncbi:Rv2175c family DNA-binding protein [Dactylosporangium sp. CA-139114]|uniref:Rv2175c family DNA-binding protein n=1 Tax=unclassified Dactylosporangium TaxID=2621675 RepID=UPI003D8D496C
MPDVAERLGIPVNRVHQLVRDHALIAVRESGVLRVPADFITDDGVVKHLPGVLTLLYDAGYNEAEALRWLYTPDESLPGTPAEALRGNRATEVKRRAQALGF